MILIDGDVTDVEASCSLLKEFSDLPLSVLAVGIGKKKFPKLKLIKKRHREDQHQDPASKKRSLFHYIKFNSVSDNISQLSLNVFAEIPKQVSRGLGSSSNT